MAVIYINFACVSGTFHGRWSIHILMYILLPMVVAFYKYDYLPIIMF